MKKLLLDTNIYGELVIDKDLDILSKEIIIRSNLIIYGLPVIRKELRAVPKSSKIGSRNLRISLLGLYDELVKLRTIQLSTEAHQLAKDYFAVYKELGGSLGKNEMNNDFLIVASCSLKQMNIVISNDETTMKSDKALKSYEIVNNIKNIRTPTFIDYNQFKKLLR